MKHHLKLFGFGGHVPTEMPLQCGVSHTYTNTIIYLDGVTRQELLAEDPTASREARVTILRRMVVCRVCVCVCVCLHVRLHVFGLTEVVCS